MWRSMSLKYSCNYHMEDCDEIMTVELADVSHMSMSMTLMKLAEMSGRIIDRFSVITVDSAPADNHESILGTVTNDLGNDTRAHTTLYSGHVEGTCGLFGNSIDTGNIAANISGFNCDHIYSVEDKLLSNCDRKSCVDDELLSNLTLKRVLSMKLILIVTQRRRLKKLVLIVTFVWLRMNLSD